MEYASNGKGNLGVTLGAIGTGLGAIGNSGILGFLGNGNGMALRADGTEVTTTEATFDDGEVGELVIDYPINVLHGEDGEHKVLIQLYAMFAGEIYGGHVIVERVI